MSFLLQVVTPLVAFGAILLFGADAYTRYQCSNYQEITGRETKWATMDSCYIKTDAGFQRWDEYKARAVASQGLSE